MGTKTGKVLAIDFDGVISNYSTFLGKNKFAEPVVGCSEFLAKLKAAGWKIIIFTTRANTMELYEYLNKYAIPFDHVNYNPENAEQELADGKVLADVYLDDRGISFNGVWDDGLFNSIVNFSPWWKKTKTVVK
jgi:hypothetical protein